MTRGEAINKAAVQYATHFVDTDETDFYGKSIQVIDLDRAEHRGFVHGARWADNNPDSPWIDVEDDLPNNPKYLKQPDYSPWVIAVTENGEVLPAQMIVMHEKWIWHSRFSRKHEDIVLWMPIPKFEEYLLWHEKRKLN